MAVKILNGIDVDGSMNIVASDVPNLDASKITSGTFSTDRIPNLSGVYQPAGDYLTLETAETTFQPIGNYLTSVPAEYLTQTEGDARYLRLSGGVLSGNLEVGATNKTSDTVVRSLADQSYKAGFEAYGNGQGTGYVYVGQSADYGGGFSYNGDGSPGFISGETADNITFYRRQAGANTEVFHYAYSNNDVYFNGAVVASGSNSNDWNTAYGWGNHASVGYLTSLPSHNHDTLYDAIGSADAVNLRIDEDVLPAIPTNNNQLTNGAGYLTTSGKAADSNLLDGLDSGSFLRSNANDIATGHYIFSYNSGVTGSSAPSYTQGSIEIFADGPNVPAIGFHRGGQSATSLYEYDGQLYVKPWTTRAQEGLLLSSGNIGSYGFATQSYVTTQINNVIDSAPGALNTLNELAAALGDDVNFSTTVANNIGAVNTRIDTEVLPAIDAKQNAGNYFTDGDTVLNMANNDGLVYDDSTNRMYVKLDGTNREIYHTGNFTDSSANWNTAYGWGNHASAGYLTSIPSTYATDAEVSSAVAAVDARIDNEIIPTIPTNNNQLTNGAGYITSYVNTTYTAGSGLQLSGTTFRLNGGEIPGGVDLNTYRTTGIYAQNSNADTTSGSNWPTNFAGILEVWNDDYGNGIHCTQRYSRYNTVDVYQRNYYNGTWTSWRNLTQDTNTTYSTSDFDAAGSAATAQANAIAHADDRIETEVLPAIPTNNNQLTNGAGYITSADGGNANLLDGLDLHTGRNNQANKVVRTNASGYADFGWINTTSGNTTSTLTDIYVNTNDGYIRKATPAHFRSQITDGSYDSIGSADAVNARIDSEVLPSIPTNNNQLTNGAGYITDGNTNWNNTYGFITEAPYIKAGGAGPSTENLNTIANSVVTGQLEYRGFNLASSNRPPASDNANGVITVGQHSGNYNAQLAFSSDGNMYFRDNPSSSFGSWRTVWDSENLDAFVGATVSNDTITFTKANGGTVAVTTSDADTNTWRPIDDTPVNGVTDQSISSNWAYDHVNASNPHGTTAADVGADPVGSAAAVNTALSEEIGNLSTTVSTNTTDIAANRTAITTNATNISALSTSISTGSVTIGSGVTLTESTDRADLLMIKSSTSTWGGLQVSNTSNEIIFSLMGDGTTGGIYDDQNSDWLIQWTENAGVRLYHNAGEKLTTTSTGVSITGALVASGDVTAFSDARVKENVETLSNALDKVKSMRGVTYNKIGEEKQSVGVIAQELEEVVPQLVHTDEEGMKSVAYGNITAVLIEALKEQQAQIEELKARLDGLTK